MVIAPGRDGISTFIILGDGECLPANLNTKTSVVMRKGKSTDNELIIVKKLGDLADEKLLRPPDVCAYTRHDGGSPLHQHDDQSWWFYDVDFVFERGPFPTRAEGLAALVAYCEDYQNKFGNDSTKTEG